MKYFISDFVVKPNSGGVESILNDVYHYALSDSSNQYVFLVGNRTLLNEAGNIKVIVDNRLQSSYLRRLLFDFVYGHKIIENERPDAVVSLQNTAILHLSVPEALYVHQPLPFIKTYSFSLFKKSERRLAFYQKIVGAVIKINLKMFKGAFVTVQTKWMAQAISKYTDTDVEIRKPEIPDLNVSRTQAKDTMFKGCFFFPGTAMLYKNHKRLVEAFMHLPEKVRANHKLVLTLSEKEFRNLTGYSANEQIILLGRISRGEVLEILSNAILVFPSEVESFGLPLIEAMQLNRRIIASDISPVLEVTQGYEGITYFDAKNVSDIRLQMLNAAKESMRSYDWRDAKNYQDTWSGFFNKLKDESEAVK